MKGITMKEGQAGVLELDGTLVFVESVTPVCAVVVALPEQPPTRNVTPSFTPGRVGGKRISPYAQFSVIIPDDQLSPRNQNFCKVFQRWRADHGINYVDRTPEEIAAADAAAKAPTKAEVKAIKAAEKAASKAARKTLKITPRYLQRCKQCGEQPGHPNHGAGDGQHEFVAPEANAVTATPDTPSGVAPTRQPAKIGSRTEGVGAGPYRWIGTPEQLDMMAASNPKYGEGNTGRVIADALGENAPITIDKLAELLALNPRTAKMNRERIDVTVMQLVKGKLIELVP